MEKFKITITNDDEYGPSIISKAKVFEMHFGIGIVIETDRKNCDFRVEVTGAGKTYADGVVVEVWDRNDEDRSTEVEILPNVPDACKHFEGKWFVNNFQGKIEAVIIKESEVSKEFSSQSNEDDGPCCFDDQGSDLFIGQFFITQSEQDADGKYVENRVSSTVDVVIPAKRLLMDSYDENNSDDQLLDFYYERIQSVYDESMGISAADEEKFLVWARSVLANKVENEG